MTAIATEQEPFAAASPFDTADELAAAVCELAARFELPQGHVVQALTAMIGELITTPNPDFENPPEYVRDVGNPLIESGEVLTSTHGFFDVLHARSSRRDFGSEPLDLARLQSLLHWTVGKRDEVIAYDFRGAPLRFVPSAGGLASVDAYVIAVNVAGLAPGSYYFDHRVGLVEIVQGYMGQKVTDMTPGQPWVADAAAIIVLVGNTGRVEHKYGAMGFKLMMLDAGVTAGHAELVATALELRSTVIGGLPPKAMSLLLDIDGRTRVPLAALAVGTRGGHA